MIKKDKRYKNIKTILKQKIHNILYCINYESRK
jgi:hypothetical protein